MSFNKRILVFSATYNEIENIRELINGIQKNLPNSSILIIDDNSPDKTQEVINELKKKNESLFLIKREKKLGLDSAHRAAFKYAIENNFDYLITMDADLSHDPSKIPMFIDELNSNSFVIGSRYIEGGRNETKLSRYLLSIVGNKIIKIVLGINCEEFTTSYRAFNLSKLSNFDIYKINAQGYSFFMETIYQIHKSGYLIKQVPIIFADRKKGISKIPKIETLRTLKNLFLLKFFS